MESFDSVDAMLTYVEPWDVADDMRAFDSLGRRLTLRAEGVVRGKRSVGGGKTLLADAAAGEVAGDELAALLYDYVRTVGSEQFGGAGAELATAPLAELVAMVAPRTSVTLPSADTGPEEGRVTIWEKRLKAPVLIAALAVLPLVALGLSQPTGAWHTVETVGHWIVWLTFVVEVAIMLSVVDDRLGWIGGHRLELLVVLVSSPVVPLALAVAPALRLFMVVKALKALKLSKAIKLAKLHKSVRLVRRKVTLTGAASIALGLLALVLGGLTAAYMVTGHSPLEGAEESAALVAAGVLVTFGVNHLTARSVRPE